MITTKTIKTPVGNMIAGATDNGICLFDFEFRTMMPVIRRRLTTFLQDDFSNGNHRHIDALQHQLDEYFSGDRKIFQLPLIFLGTEFQQRVWQALTDIPYGETRSYLQQSKVLGDEKAIRAVARANGENCIAILVPCHRVLGSDGSLTGYAGGLKAKKWLLEHEACFSGRSLQQEIF